MITISGVGARIVQDSRGEDTIEVSLHASSLVASASIPSGKSTGAHEAVPLPASAAHRAVTELAPQLTGRSFSGLLDFDAALLALDGTPSKWRLGANTLLGLSISFARLEARAEGVPLHALLGRYAEVRTPQFPRLFANLVNGGRHASAAAHPLPFQEYLAVPRDHSPSQALVVIERTFAALAELVRARGGVFRYGDEGGFVVSGEDPEAGILLLREALGRAGYAERAECALDTAASGFFRPQPERYAWYGVERSPEELHAYYRHLANAHALLAIEDPFAEDAWSAWREFTLELGGRLWVVGDDLTVTNVGRMRVARDAHAVNAVVIKPNQIGTVSETLDAVRFAKKERWRIIVSHRSGETEDEFIADLAYGTAADGLKVGVPIQKERLAKYHRLVAIEKEVR